jgi:antitoxin VapB
MTTAKIFQHGGSQAIRLPKAFRFEGAEVVIEKRGDEVVLKALPAKIPELKSLGDVSRYFAETYPDAASFPDAPKRPKNHERPILEW